MKVILKWNDLMGTLPIDEISFRNIDEFDPSELRATMYGKTV